ncbi:hypothetical protein A3D77_06675 [Candidatus Gottesmanbacteria bacterium RIFCSPHIGHO2_02_FULL_39_11]|uniref:N-acetyltransferase domain-containing protein n=1 Tax=Candidatus Gottesmanbacteria bacterium RIFCSPHIGHO2_02_FULL_39_11 TaxID=1798382 RepID=A0A1F5ZTQ3_9BACT|nr:MAG: hypothetical protein A3D77_06675 [Candidatus Gottesmanbacteria bacterium RIFCSPHIGHO2_02_FULL_39_11]
MIKIHKAKVEDALEIKKLLHKTWTATYSNIYSPEAIETVISEWHSLKFLKKQIQDPDTFFLIAKDGDIIVAMCNASLTHESKAVNIQRLHVLSNYQRQGIGSMLVIEVIKSFPNVSKIELEVEKQNLRAQAFYKKHGFKSSGEKVFEVKNVRMECFVMEKTV